MKNRGGFTIIETLISLAVASVLFVVIMTMFSGRQGRVEFSQGIREIDSHLRSIAGEVRNGYFPKLEGVECFTNPATELIEFRAGSLNQGTNKDCIFAGKVVFIDAGSQVITRYTVAGSKKATSLSNLNPVVVNGSLSGGINFDSSDTFRIPAGIKLVTERDPNPKALLGIFYDLDFISTDLTSGSASLTLKKLSIASSDINSIKNSVANAFTASPTATDISNSGLLLCFKSGTSDQYGTIKISKSVSGFSTEVLIGENISGKDCVNG